MNRQKNIKIICEYLAGIEFEGRFIVADGSEEKGIAAKL